MSPEIRILYQLCHSEIFESTIATESDLKAWVANGRYLVKDKLSLKTSKARSLVSCKFNLLVRDTDFLYASLANDCNRFAQSSIESVSVIKQDAALPKNISWPLIQMYYASFFAIHAILRLFGKACSQFESDHMEAVLDIAMATNQHNGATNIENGFYFTKFCKRKQELSFGKLKDSHADTWSSFSDLLANLIQMIPDFTNGLSTQKDKTMDLLIKLKDLISKSGSQRGNWLSKIRNKVNYQHSHGAWYPYQSGNYSHELLYRNKLWMNDPSTFDHSLCKNDIDTFFCIGNSIISLMYHLMKYGFDRSDRVSNTFRNGAFRLVNQIDSN